nr:FHA domain-containing protein [Petrachloros mirabilis]
MHPVQSTPVQSWSFDQDPVIRIGRAVDNHVVLYSAVVSRYHVELRKVGQQWDVVNIGTNGTYLDGKRVHQAPLSSGNVMRLARSGPNIQIQIQTGTSPASNPATLTDPQVAEPLASPEAFVDSEDAPAPSEEPVAAVDPSGTSASPPDESQGFSVQGIHPFPSAVQLPQPCAHERAKDGDLFCVECGHPLKVWRTIAAYTLLKRLGTSENTFVGWREGHTVVLKTLKPDWAGQAEAIGNFQHQAEALCQLSHPGMPKIYEAFEAGGQSFVVSDLIYGQTLKQWVALRGPLSEVQAVSWILDLCDLLQYLQQQDPPIVHPSLKPSNLIRPTIPHGYNPVVLVDFGEVKQVTPEAGTLVGAVGYAAPEQQTGKATPASNLYSLGGILVYLLTGQEPDAFYRLVDQVFRLQIQDMARLSPAMQGIIEQLTHPRPEDRYRSVQAVVRDLQQLL